MNNEKEAEIEKMVAFETLPTEPELNENDVQELVKVVSRRCANEEEEMAKCELLEAKLEAWLKRVRSKKVVIEQTEYYVAKRRAKKAKKAVPIEETTAPDAGAGTVVGESSEANEVRSPPLISQTATLANELFGGDDAILPGAEAPAAEAIVMPSTDAGGVKERRSKKKKRTADEMSQPTQAAAPNDTSFVEQSAVREPTPMERLTQSQQQVSTRVVQEQHQQEEDENEDAGDGDMAAKRVLLRKFAMYDGKRIAHPNDVLEDRWARQFYMINVHPRKSTITYADVAETGAINEFMDDAVPTPALYLHEAASLMLNCKNNAVTAIISALMEMISKKHPIDFFWNYLNSLYTILIKRPNGNLYNGALNLLFIVFHEIKKVKFNLKWQRGEISECDKPKKQAKK